MRVAFFMPAIQAIMPGWCVIEKSGLLANCNRSSIAFGRWSMLEKASRLNA